MGLSQHRDEAGWKRGNKLESRANELVIDGGSIVVRICR